MSWLGVFLVTGVIAAVLSTGSARAAGAGDAADELRRLAERRIFFGHQSVGENVLDGLRQLSAQHGAPLDIRETTDPREVRPGTVAHAHVGQNGDPAGKLDAFAAALRGGMGDAVDVALVKFCYVDFDASTDVGALMHRYRTVMADLQGRFPRTTFVHVTVPLMTVERGPKAWAKRLLGRPDRLASNARRDEFNTLLRREFGGKAPLFDLAAAESRWPDGHVESYAWGGRSVPALVPTYSSDGGHLNAEGQAAVARHFLEAVAR